MTVSDLEQRLAVLEAENRLLRARLMDGSGAALSEDSGQAHAPGGHDGDPEPPAVSDALSAALSQAQRDLAVSRAALTASEVRYEAIVESATDYAIFTTDLTGRITSWNTGAEHVLGWPAAAILGQDSAVIFTEEDRAAGAPEQERRDALGQGRAIDERWHLRRDGTPFWAHGVLSPLRDGSLKGFLKILRDRTGQRMVQQRLSESEARFRHLADSVPALIWMTDEAGQLTFANMHYDHVFGRPAADMLGEGWAAVVLPEDLERYKAAFTSAFQARGPFHSETRVRDAKGEVRWLRCAGVPRLDDAHRFLGYTGCNVDITDAKRAEAQREMMTRELHHRVKNSLATVQAIANATARQADSLAAFRVSFTDRLVALSKTHTLLMEHDWTVIPLVGLLLGELQPYEVEGGPQARRIRLSGEPAEGVELPSDSALALGMSIHELATNAAKYGALSVETGRLSVTWSVVSGVPADQDGARPSRLLRLEWREEGGPPILAAPERSGFGSKLIRRMLTDAAREGSVELDFNPEGLRASLVVPLDVNLDPALRAGH